MSGDCIIPKERERRCARKIVLLFAAVLLVPMMLVAGPATMGAYFGYEPGLRMYDPVPFSFFDVFIYLHNAGVYVTAVDYQLQTPGDPVHVLFGYSEVAYPDQYSVSWGELFLGHSITYWPPLDGFNPGYNMICKFKGFTTEPCWNVGGSMIEYLLVVGPHPDTGEIKGT